MRTISIFFILTSLLICIAIAFFHNGLSRDKQNSTIVLLRGGNIKISCDDAFWLYNLFIKMRLENIILNNPEVKTNFNGAVYFEDLYFNIVKMNFYNEYKPIKGNGYNLTPSQILFEEWNDLLDYTINNLYNNKGLAYKYKDELGKQQLYIYELNVLVNEGLILYKDARDRLESLYCPKETT